MPPAGFVGIKLTPQRKLMIDEVMKSENVSKPSEALDIALALAQDFVKPDESELTELPDYLNYYVGETAAVAFGGRYQSDEGTVAPLVAQERVNKMVSNLTWRLDALAFVRNVEPTITKVPDAIDFALSAYIMGKRSGHVSEKRLAEIRAQVKRNAVAFKAEVQEFLADNMADVEMNARLDGTKVKARKSITTKRDAALGIAHAMYVQHLQKFNRAIKDGDAAAAAYEQSEIDRLEAEMLRIERDARNQSIKDMSEKAKRYGSVAVRTDSEGNRTAEKSNDEIPF